MRYNFSKLKEKLENGYRYSHKGTDIGGLSATKGIVGDEKKVMILTKENGAFDMMEYPESEIEKLVSLFREYGQEVNL